MKIKHWIIKKLGGVPREYTNHYTINNIRPTIHVVRASFTYDVLKDRQFPKDYLMHKLMAKMSEQLHKFMDIEDGIKVGNDRAVCQATLYVVMPYDVQGEVVLEGEDHRADVVEYICGDCEGRVNE